jgi:Flp pilus assembly protein protease CpaA
MNLIFWFFLAGFLIAGLQDLKRREVDNWLNLFLFFSGFLFVLFEVFLYNELSYLVNFGFLALIMFLLAHGFYYLKLFAGGDCKLLFAVTPLLVSVDIANSLYNLLFFCASILFVGAVYGACWIAGLFIVHFGKIKRGFYRAVRNYYYYAILLAIMLLLGFFENFLLKFALLFIFIFILFLAGLCVEGSVMLREVDSSLLREGDWIEKNIRVKGRVIQSSFEGLSAEQVAFLKRNCKKVRIRDGIPFAPVFLFSWIIFYFRGWFMEFLVSALAG